MTKNQMMIEKINQFDNSISLLKEQVEEVEVINIIYREICMLMMNTLNLLIRKRIEELLKTSLNHFNVLINNVIKLMELIYHYIFILN